MMNAQTKETSPRAEGYDLGTPVLSAREFASALQEERARADREGSVFSLAAFRVTNELPGNQAAKSLTAFLATRRRTGDTIGWIDKRYLGVLLPSTRREGCRRFVGQIVEHDHLGALPYATFLYGEKWSYLARIDTADEPNAQDHDRKECSEGNGTLDQAGIAYLENCLKQLFARGVPVSKRLLDIVGSLVAILLFAPVGMVLALYIKLVSPGPVLFKQQRVGYKGELFTFRKFRTMHVGNDHSNHTSHLRDLINSEKPMEKLDEAGDPRIIPGGRIIRKSCMDELPQLFNVLRGEMSLVGPRPCLPYEMEEYLRWHAYRFDVLPGITGLWQVSGKNKLTFRQMIRLDIAYCRTMSFRLDVKILLLTGPAILSFIFGAVARRLKRNGEESPITGPHTNEGSR